MYLLHSLHLIFLTLSLALLPVKPTGAMSAIPASDFDTPSRSYCASTPQSLLTSPNAGCGLAQNQARNNATSTLYIKGGSSVVYMRLQTTDPISQDKYNSTAVFFPTVDDYSQMVIPNSWPALTANLSESTQPSIAMKLLYRNTLYETEDRRFAVIANGQTVYVPARTVVATLENGAVKSFDWFSTACTLSTCSCLDNICTEPCSAGNCTITVYMGWAGTDSTGDILTSSARDVWRFENAF
ncbi:hypothetical protein DFS34DRAFT_598123 [Phlyctochytrium arcticum]|nr:hypothetical protein DFS34DRAFT_598123 [Phlyctochytrium arcticum]